MGISAGHGPPEYLQVFPVENVLGRFEAYALQESEGLGLAEAINAEIIAGKPCNVNTDCIAMIASRYCLEHVLIA